MRSAYLVSASKKKQNGEFTIVPSHKGVAVGPPLLSVDVLLRLLERDVHVAVHGLQLACADLVSLRPGHVVYVDIEFQSSEQQVGSWGVRKSNGMSLMLV